MAKRYLITLKYEADDLTQRMLELNADGVNGTIMKNVRGLLEGEEGFSLPGRVEFIQVDELR